MRRPKTYHHGRLRESLVDAAIAQANKAGIASITMRAVAERLGVTPAAAYHHFESKEHLLAACSERVFAEMLTRLEQALEPVRGGAVDQIEAFGRAYIEFFVAHPEAFRIVFGSHVRLIDRLFDERSAGRKVRAMLLRVATNAAQELGDLEAEQIVQATWSTAAGAVALIIERELSPTTSDAEIAKMIDTVLLVLRRGLTGSSSPSRVER